MVVHIIYAVIISLSSGRDDDSRQSSERDVANTFTPDKADLESSEVQTEIDAGLNMYA